MCFELGTNTFGVVDGRIHPGDEHFSPGNEHIENAHSSVSCTHTPTASYQQLPNRIYVEMIAIVTATYL